MLKYLYSINLKDIVYVNACVFPFSEMYINHVKSSEKYDMKIQHYHDAYEIYLQADGERYLFLDDICYTLKQGDLVILKPFDIHYMESRDIDFYERYVLNFSSDMLSGILTKTETDILFDNIKSCVFHLNDEQFTLILDYFKKIDAFSNRIGLLSEKLALSSVFQLVSVIKDLSKKCRNYHKSKHSARNSYGIDYINNHYKEDINLDIITEVVHISKYHFSRLFHKATGATFLQYLYNVRLVNVHSLLAETNLNLNEIAIRTGFSSSAHLSKNFQASVQCFTAKIQTYVKREIKKAVINTAFYYC